VLGSKIIAFIIFPYYYERMSVDLVLPLEKAIDVSLCGGKAAAIGELIRTGFETVGGFVVTTTVFGKMDNDLEAEILRNYDNLGSKYVAVRSSATSEDSKEAAWAGQLDTFLNVSRNELISSVEKCWVSIESGRASSYARQHNIKAGKVAVIVQPMIQFYGGGVAFSVHPVTQEADKIVIEMALGLEAVVSGETTPDTYIVRKKSGDILEKHIANQNRKMVQGKDGKTKWQQIGTKGSSQKLSDEKIKELAKEIARLEKHFGYPVDVEWGLVDDKILIMQCRPITTLQSSSYKKTAGTSDNWRHYLTRSYTLFGASLWQHSYESDDAEKVFGMRLYDGLFIEDRPRVVRQYRIESQLAEFKTHFESLLKERYDEFRDFLNEAGSLNEFTKKHVLSAQEPFSEVEEAVAFLDKLFIRATVLPYWSLDAMERLKVKDEAVEKQTKELRAVSYYPTLIEKVIIPLAIKKLKRLGIKNPEKVINLLTYKELPAVNQMLVDKRLLSSAKGYRFRYEVHKGSKTISWSKSLNEEVAKIEELPKLGKDLKLDGQTAYPGVVKGNVRLVLTQDDLRKKVTAKDIIVTINANPQFLPLIQQCSGIIADEGGIMSHASILAREFKKPCIVGSRFGTVVLNEGDEVILNATDQMVIRTSS